MNPISSPQFSVFCQPGNTAGGRSSCSILKGKIHVQVEEGLYTFIRQYLREAELQCVTLNGVHFCVTVDIWYKITVCPTQIGSHKQYGLEYGHLTDGQISCKTSLCVRHKWPYSVTNMVYSMVLQPMTVWSYIQYPIYLNIFKFHQVTM